MERTAFNSFFMGGFECSTHRDRSGRRLDLIASTGHDRFALQDYGRMVEHGMTTCRDGARWHLIEREPFKYDFSSLESQVTAAKATGMEVIWDYFHYGYPDDIDIFSSQFSERFAAFASELTEYLTENLGPRLHLCPVNEISFFSWIAAERGVFYPCKRGRGDELKQCLVEASRSAADAIRQIAPEATIMFTDPAIHVVPKDNTAQAKRAAESYRRAQFQAYDLLEEGRNTVHDLIGLNYYFHNQWRHPSRRKIPRGHPQYRPLNEILGEYYERYGRPILLAETGIEDEDRPDWFRYVCEQVAVARANGIPVEGVCLYPIVNHPGWADDRHCHNGLWDYADRNGHRPIYEPLSAEIFKQMEQLGAPAQCRLARAAS